MMRISGQFTTTLDLGEIGEREAIVSYAGYRTATPDVDDRNEMKIVDVRIANAAGLAFDITSWLNDASIESLEAEALETKP